MYVATSRSTALMEPGSEKHTILLIRKPYHKHAMSFTRWIEYISLFVCSGYHTRMTHVYSVIVIDCIIIETIPRHCNDSFWGNLSLKNSMNENIFKS